MVLAIRRLHTFLLSSNDEHSAVRMLDHPRRHAPKEKPVNGAQPFSPHHNQIGPLLRGRLHDLFSRLPDWTQWLG